MNTTQLPQKTFVTITLRDVDNHFQDFLHKNELNCQMDVKGKTFERFNFNQYHEERKKIFISLTSKDSIKITFFGQDQKRSGVQPLEISGKEIINSLGKYQWFRLNHKSNKVNEAEIFLMNLAFEKTTEEADLQQEITQKDMENKLKEIMQLVDTTHNFKQKNANFETTVQMIEEDFNELVDLQREISDNYTDDLQFKFVEKQKSLQMKLDIFMREAEDFEFNKTTPLEETILDQPTKYNINEENYTQAAKKDFIKLNSICDILLGYIKNGSLGGKSIEQQITSVKGIHTKDAQQIKDKLFTMGQIIPTKYDVNPLRFQNSNLKAATKKAASKSQTPIKKVDKEVEKQPENQIQTLSKLPGRTFQAFNQKPEPKKKIENDKEKLIPSRYKQNFKQATYLQADTKQQGEKFVALNIDENKKLVQSKSSNQIRQESPSFASFNENVQPQRSTPLRQRNQNLIQLQKTSSDNQLSPKEMKQKQTTLKETKVKYEDDEKIFKGDEQIKEKEYGIKAIQQKYTQRIQKQDYLNAQRVKYDREVNNSVFTENTVPLNREYTQTTLYPQRQRSNNRRQY